MAIPIPRKLTGLENAMAAENLFGNQKNVAALENSKGASVRQTEPIEKPKQNLAVPKPTEKVEGENLKPVSVPKPKSGEVDNDWLKIKSGEATRINQKPLVYDGDTYTYEGLGKIRVNGIDAWDKKEGKETTEYTKSRMFLTDFFNNNKEVYSVPSGETDVYGRQVGNIMAVGKNGLIKYDSLAMANNMAGPYNFRKGKPEKVLEPLNDRMSKLQSMYPDASKITLANQPNHIWISKNKKKK